jgi:hypothetical protein
MDFKNILINFFLLPITTFRLGRGGCTGGEGGMHVHPVHPPWVRPCLKGLSHNIFRVVFWLFLRYTGT